jgi:cation diffusion facilitator CzcD-associated flavoprotein CzcO
MTVATDITIVGAGPYGLSLAAHLRACGMDFRIIGSPMRNWRFAMPEGMLLKSAGFASTLHDPGRTHTLRRFCEERGIPYQDIGLPVRIETFNAYGLAFQKKLVPDLIEEQVVSLAACRDGFELRMEGGAMFRSRKVVLATGIDYFRYLPPLLARLPRELCTHSAEHRRLDGFRHRHVAVFGGGASAIDIAVLLHEAGASVQLIARKPGLRFGLDESAPRPLRWRLRAPMSGVGAGWKNRLCTDVPWLYRYLPDRVRLRTVARFLGPAGGWFMKMRAAQVPRLLGFELRDAETVDGRVLLRLAGMDGTERHVSADHVIAATGYGFDVRRLPYLDSDIVGRLKLIGRAPRLSAHFESSIPGLYFAGPIAAPSFGPVMRFVAGAEFTCKRISKHLLRRAGAPALSGAAAALARPF